MAVDAPAVCNAAKQCYSATVWHHVTYSLELGYVKPLITAINPKEREKTQHASYCCCMGTHLPFFK
jgi:hypothetical protein